MSGNGGNLYSLRDLPGTYEKSGLGHPDNKIKNEQDALDSWMARAAEKVIGM